MNQKVATPFAMKHNWGITPVDQTRASRLIEPISNTCDEGLTVADITTNLNNTYKQRLGTATAEEVAYVLDMMLHEGLMVVSHGDNKWKRSSRSLS